MEMPQNCDLTAGPIQLTLAMIVRDGGQNLAPLLADATPWVDEMVIGDTGSRDDSVAVCVQHGAQVHQIGWRDDFAWARNQVLERCTGRWIVVLDADEQLAAADWQTIRTWIAAQDVESAPLAASIATRNYLPQRQSRRGWQPVPADDPHALAGGAPTAGFVVTNKVRLFPNRPDVRFRGPVHETVEVSLWEAGISIIELPVPVHHFGYLVPRGDKDERYLHLAHRKTTSQPHDPQAWAELAECAIAVGDHRQALVAMERSLRLEPRNPDRCLTAGWLYKETHDYAAAEAQLAGLAALGDNHKLLVAEAAHLRAQMAMQREAPREAAVLLAEALRRYPDNGNYQNTLGALNLMLGRGKAAHRALRLACDLLPDQAAPCLNLALLHENAGNADQARLWYTEALRREPDNPQADSPATQNTLAPVSR